MESGAAMVPGVWYDLSDGVLFKLYDRSAWLHAVADFQVLTNAFDWDSCIPPFVQEHRTEEGNIVTLSCSDSENFISIRCALDA